MAYDEGLAHRIREVLGSQAAVEKKMFGGVAFMVQGNMCCGVQGEDLMLRVGPDQHATALAQPHSRPMDFTGRAMKGFILVGPEGYADDDALQQWVGMALSYTRSLPPK